MKDLIHNIKKIPLELQIKIFQYYYSYLHNEIMNEIKNIYILENKITKFIKNYVNSLIKENNLYYYKKFNDNIKKISHNNGKILLCKINNLKLGYCNLDYINKICYDIKDDYKYIAPILIYSSGINRYYMKSYLTSL